MRGALGKIPGVGNIDIEVEKKPFKVHFDKTKTNVDAILAALSKAGEPAKKL